MDGLPEYPGDVLGSSLGRDLAERFARTALGHVTLEYPNKLDHVLNGPPDVRSPRALHPLFFGSFDWHSNVHAYWLLATLLRRAPALPDDVRREIRALFDGQLTAPNVAAEMAYLTQPSRGTFERPYGWAWLLMLAAELARHDGDEGRRWHETITPLARAFADRFRAFLPRATYPIRVGTHFNTAFAVALALEYAEQVGDDALASMLRETAIAWYGEDADCQAWEPGGDDFLSSALMEAECMRRVLGAEAWRPWMERFLPRVLEREPATLFRPVQVSDPTDGKIAHLIGLNLSRGWCWMSCGHAWTAMRDPRGDVAADAAMPHIATGLGQMSASDYAGAHWLATFALLALLA